MSLKRVLLPYDASAEATRALVIDVDIARSFDAELLGPQ